MSADHDLIVATLPGYEIGKELGRGAFATVFAARHRALDREVAVKHLFTGPGSGAQPLDRFRAEARVLASFDHPHLVAVYDFVEDGGLCLLIMERLTGGTLGERLDAGGLTPEEACAIVIAASAGLQYVHEHDVLHRDVKPANLMFSSQGVLKVTDFGIAKVLGGFATVMTEAGQLLGTPAYMAPEQIEEEELTPATDVYALGTVLYELLAGELPYPDTPDVRLALYNHVYEKPRPLRQVAPQVSGPLADVTARALARDADERYPTMTQFGLAVAGAATAAWGSAWSPPETGASITPADVSSRPTSRGKHPPGHWAGPGNRRQPPVGPVDRRIDLPVYRPAPGHRPPSVAVVAISAAAVAAMLAVAAYALATRYGDGPSEGPRPGAIALMASDATITLEPSTGVLHCPEGRARFTASVRTNGGTGILTYQWTRPDGTKGDVSKLALARGQGSVTTSLDFTFTGQGQARGQSTFDVLGPNQFSVAGPEVAYMCP